MLMGRQVAEQAHSRSFRRDDLLLLLMTHVLIQKRVLLMGEDRAGARARRLQYAGARRHGSSSRPRPGRQQNSCARARRGTMTWRPEALTGDRHQRARCRGKGAARRQAGSRVGIWKIAAEPSIENYAHEKMNHNLPPTAWAAVELMFVLMRARGAAHAGRRRQAAHGQALRQRARAYELTA